MRLTPERVTSLGIALLYVALGLGEGLEYGLGLAICLIWPVALVWFAEPLATYRGWAGWIPIRRDSHPLVLRIMGWFFLALVAAVYAVRCFSADSSSQIVP